MKEMNAATQIVAMLGAYCPRVKLSDEKALEIEKAKAKRRTRPMIGRGKYGENLMAHFDLKRKKAKKQEVEILGNLSRRAA
jgi:hypothetical protein